MASKKKKKQSVLKKEFNPKRIEFSKLMIALVMSMFFLVTFVGVYICVFIDCSQYSILTTFVGAASTSAFGFYLWKAKNENVKKIENCNEDDK